MPVVTRKMTEREWGGHRWWGRGYQQSDFLDELYLFGGTTRLNVGPRGGRTYGSGQLTTRSFLALKARVQWRGLVFIEDPVTRKVHIRRREVVRDNA